MPQMIDKVTLFFYLQVLRFLMLHAFYEKSLSIEEKGLTIQSR
jgi:hypothetical protein